jgi:hypothetical protein
MIQESKQCYVDITKPIQSFEWAKFPAEHTPLQNIHICNMLIFKDPLQ